MGKSFNLQCMCMKPGFPHKAMGIDNWLMGMKDSDLTMLEWSSRYQLFSSKFPRCLAMFENHCTNGTPSSTLAWRIPWMEEPGGLQSMASLGVNTTERLHFHFSLSCIGEGNGNPLQCSCLETPKDGLAWWAAVCGVARSRTRLKRLSSSSST